VVKFTPSDMLKNNIKQNDLINNANYAKKRDEKLFGK
jgi:hypothetical protein